MIKNGFIFEFDKTHVYENGRVVTKTMMPIVCYICRQAGCPHCHIAPRTSERLGLLRKDGRIIRSVKIDRCTLIRDGAVLDNRMEITTNGKKKQTMASELVAHVWYTETEE